MFENVLIFLVVIHYKIYLKRKRKAKKPAKKKIYISDLPVHLVNTNFSL